MPTSDSLPTAATPGAGPVRTEIEVDGVAMVRLLGAEKATATGEALRLVLAAEVAMDGLAAHHFAEAVAARRAARRGTAPTPDHHS